MKTNIEPGCRVIVVGGCSKALGKIADVVRFVDAGESMPEFFGRSPEKGAWYIDYNDGTFGLYQTKNLRRIDDYKPEHRERREELVHG